MNERDLQYFAAVATHAHLGRAAEGLGLSQPALSMSLRRLENEMDAKLVRRTPKGVELTRIGETLLSHVTRLRVAHKDVMQEITDLKRGTAGELRVGLQSGLAEELVAIACAALLRDTEKVLLKATVSEAHVRHAALRNGQLDLLLESVPSMASGELVYEKLLDDEFVVYASANHPLTRRREVTAADVSEQLWATAGTTGPSPLDVNHIFSESSLDPPRAAIESNSLIIRRRLVASSHTLGFGSRLMVKRYAHAFGLKEIRVKDLRAVRYLVTAYRGDGYLSPAARRFIGLLRVAAKTL